MLIPKLMATQHPDSTKRIGAYEEVDEAIEAFTKFGCDEVMVDYEGKLTPYHQMEWIVEKAHSLGIAIGRELLLTPRVPRDDVEDMSRHIIALTSAVLANIKAYRLGLEPPVKYVVVPMTESVRDAIRIQNRLIQIEKVLGIDLGYPSSHTIAIVPLIESIERQIHADSVAEALYNALVRDVSLFMDKLRVFLGKSDSALSAGHIASSIALKIALNRLSLWSEEKAIEIKTIIGMGKPPFRGHLAPHNVDTWIRCWRPYSTVTIQSALRYDTDYDSYRHTIEVLLSHRDEKGMAIGRDEEKTLIKVMTIARDVYTRNLEKLKGFLPQIFEAIPSTRDRVHYRVYGRSVKGTVLPRAIRFTAAMYSIGIPPTLLDIEALSIVSSRELELLLEVYPGLAKDISYDLSLYSREIALEYLPREAVEYFDECIRRVRDMLGVDKMFDIDEEYWRYAKMLALTLKEDRKEIAQQFATAMAKMRGFLG